MPADTSEPRAVFRVDASLQIGGGHVRRCLALADAFAAEGWAITFATVPGTADVVPALSRSSHQRIVVPAGEFEIEELHARLPGGCALLVVDHYGLDARFERACRGWAEKILVIDDLADRRHDCDVLVDQTPDRTAGDYANWVPKQCLVLTGAQYALLDRRFRLARERSQEPRGEVQRVLVSFGWTDASGPIAMVLEALHRAKLATDVDLVLGSGGANVAHVRDLAANLKPSARVHVAVDDMAGLLQNTDLAVGAGGVSALERCCLGVPSIIMTVAENQRGNADALARAGAAIVLGSWTMLEAEIIAREIRDLADNPGRRQAMFQAGRRLCDGRGAERVAQHVTRLCAGDHSAEQAEMHELQLRFATADDARAIWEWRNDPESRAMSRALEPVVWGDHVNWFARKLESSETAILIGMMGDERAGVIRFDRRGECADVSISIAPHFRGRGIGKALLSKGCRMIEQNGFACRLEAAVKPDNVGSQRIFEAAGFVAVDRDQSMLYYRRGR